MPTQLTYKLVIFSCQNELENTPVFHSSFSGKEKDSETGYYYFGARYYNPDLSLWLSVDPMSDKYPSLSPYNYCAWNPMKLVDPDGAEIWKPEILENGEINYVAEKGDNEKTLQEQYAVGKSTAHELYGKMKNGKISGEDVKSTTGSDILRLRWKGNSNAKKAYHLGFSIMYNHVKKSDEEMRLNDFFSDMPQEMGENCKITPPSYFSKKNCEFQIPVIGGKSINATYFESSAAGKSSLVRDCYGIISKKEGTVRLQMNIFGPRSGCNGAPVIHIQVSANHEQIFRKSYGN